MGDCSREIILEDYSEDIFNNNYKNYNIPYKNIVSNNVLNKTLINYEIKISLGGKFNNKFNYVQIRLNHDIDYYILTAYYLSVINLKSLGELFIFLIDKDNMKNIINNYGHYAHGTLKKNGKKTFDDLNDPYNMKEYALRPKYGDKCWNDLDGQWTAQKYER